MNCPYCGIRFNIDGINADYSFPRFGRLHPYGGAPSKGPDDKDFSITSHKCPECQKQIMWLNELQQKPGVDSYEKEVVSTALLYPKHTLKQLPSGIPDQITQDFQEAHMTMQISSKASAALSRRCLQNLIREQEKIVERTLSAEIAKLLQTNKLPQYLADDLDAIRQVGNFAAHPIKDTHTGAIIDVELGEAEWTLEVLEELIRFYFERQPRSSARRDALNQKLRSAGKGSLIQP